MNPRRRRIRRTMRKAGCPRFWYNGGAPNAYFFGGQAVPNPRRVATLVYALPTRMATRATIRQHILARLIARGTTVDT